MILSRADKITFKEKITFFYRPECEFLLDIFRQKFAYVSRGQAVDRFQRTQLKKQTKGTCLYSMKCLSVRGSTSFDAMNVNEVL